MECDGMCDMRSVSSKVTAQLPRIAYTGLTRGGFREQNQVECVIYRASYMNHRSISLVVEVIAFSVTFSPWHKSQL